MARLKDFLVSATLFSVCCLTMFVNRKAFLQWKTALELVTDDGTAQSPIAKPLLHQVAPSLFGMNAETGLIDFPDEIDTVIIDVGARDSDYMRLLETRAEKSPQSIALILVDPLPDSIVPLQKRVADYTMHHKDPRWLNQTYTNRVFCINGAMAEREGQTTFNVGNGPACSSLLETSANNTFFCAKAQRKMPVLVYTLADLLALIPQRPTITSLHLKVDAEGADFIVLKGARDAITRFHSVVIECKAGAPSAEKETIYDNECYYEPARAYMLQHGFDGAGVEVQGGLVNAYFWQRNRTHIPSYLTQPPVTHRNLYANMGRGG